MIVDEYGLTINDLHSISFKVLIQLLDFCHIIDYMNECFAKTLITKIFVWRISKRFSVILFYFFIKKITVCN